MKNKITSAIVASFMVMAAPVMAAGPAAEGWNEAGGEQDEACT